MCKMLNNGLPLITDNISSTYNLSLIPEIICEKILTPPLNGNKTNNIYVKNEGIFRLLVLNPFVFYFVLRYY